MGKGVTWEVPFLEKLGGRQYNERGWNRRNLSQRNNGGTWKLKKESARAEGEKGYSQDCEEKYVIPFPLGEQYHLVLKEHCRKGC